MTNEQAFSVIRQACAAFVGNLNDHQNIQKALEVAEKALLPELSAKAAEKLKKTPKKENK